MSTTTATHQTGRWHQWDVADRLRAAREGMEGSPDQKTFAEQSGIGRNTVGRYETHGYGKWKKSTVKLWAAETGFDFDWLWEGVTPRDDDPDGGSRNPNVTIRNLKVISGGKPKRLVPTSHSDLEDAA